MRQNIQVGGRRSSAGRSAPHQDASMPSLAHNRSRNCIIDPCYSATRLWPRPDLGRGAPWCYGPGQLEAWRLLLVRARGWRDCTGPFHPGPFAAPQYAVTFRRRLDLQRVPRRCLIAIRAVGSLQLVVGNRTRLHRPDSDTVHRLDLAPFLAVGTVELRVICAGTGEPPALRIAAGPFATGVGWEWSCDGMHWQPAVCQPATASGLPPHRVDEPVVALESVGRDGDVWDFGRELLARVVVRGGRPVRLTAGESPAEVRHAPRGDHEQRFDLVRRGEATVSDANLALRYVRVEGAAKATVTAEASFHPVRYRGAFACSDKRLDAIWMRSAYTLRLCMQDFLLDGLKRDRMPWVGDLALSALADAYTFADGAIVRRTLTALYGRGIADCHLNGIVDYSLWWPIALDLHRLHIGEHPEIAGLWPQARELLAGLERRCDDDGLIRAEAGDWVFIDWVELRKDGISTAVQVLWRWALAAFARLALAAGDPATAARAGSLGRRVQRGLARAWTAQGYRMLVDRETPPCRHATFLASLAGVLPSGGRAAARRLLAGEHRPAVGTPYMAAFQAAALIDLDAVPEALAQIRTTWGGMLDAGATTCWEAFNAEESGDQHLAFYGRPFGRSLCHAWGSGPAALLPGWILGIRPLAPGWTRAAVAPRLADLAWACATVPTPLGDLEVCAENGRCSVRVPAGMSLELGGRTWQGPVRAEWVPQ
jgi:alpha-L-rhamnosidase